MSFRNYQIRFGGPVSPAVKSLLALNLGIFILQQIVGQFNKDLIPGIFGLSHEGLAVNHYGWQIITYMFLHGGWIHILFNLFTLWMFAGELEQRWGTKSFFKFYLLSGIGAGLFIALMNMYMAGRYPGYAGYPTLGASGALYALLLAYGIIWPNREVLLYFIFPVKMKYLVIFFGLIEFFGTMDSMNGSDGNISHIGHLGGLITGFIILKIWEAKKPSLRKVKVGFITSIIRRLRNKKKQREISIRIKAKETIDTLLDKIAREGMASLTAEERQKLEWARTHYYPSDDETIH